jgi:hypothetical protein
MSMTVQDQDGNDVEIYARQSGGYIDTIVRADSQQAFETAALARNILVQDAEGNLAPSKGVSIDALGPVMLTAGTYDAEGNELTPPTFDNRYHVNMRIGEFALSVMDADFPDLPSWVVTGITWTLQGQPDSNVNASETAKVLYSVALIDPDSISSPSRVWA